MSAETCTRSQCPEMPKVTLDQAVIDLMESIALQETALSHILCAESQKMKVAMGLDGLDLCKLLEVNDSATNMVHAVANLELVLKDKLEFISNNLYYPPSGSGCRAGIFVYRLFTESLHKNRKMHLLELLRRSICAIL
jgi:hypothetical protein